ncbi:antitoxin Xre/MbcA/ParS toxin-binding domain-containing protein [Xanthobacteraceae bacterium A53D]
MSISSPSLSPADRPEAGTVITKAVLRAADHLGLTARLLAEVIGVSEATVSRMRKAGFVLEAGSKPFELAVLLVRLFRGLDAIVGGDGASAKAWMQAENLALGGVPAQRIRSVTGLIDVIAYLDARRARV